MPRKRVPLSKGELDVARALWELGEGTVGQVSEVVKKQREIDYSTVHTYLRRLEEKRYVRTRRLGRYKLYSAQVRPRQVIRETVQDLMNRLFDGEAFALVDHLIRDHGLSEEDTRKLRKTLARLEAEREPSSDG